MSLSAANIFIIIVYIIGIIYGIINYYLVMRIDTTSKKALISDENEEEGNHVDIMNQTGKYIQDGANTFLIQEYLYLSIFVVFFFIVIILIDDFKFFTAIAFLLGACASIFSGYVGMYVATRANVRVTYCAATITDEREGMKAAFNAAFRGGCTMSFFLTSLALLVLVIIIICFRNIMGDLVFTATADNDQTFTKLFEYVAGYGRGGIYTKAADVGADLVGKNEFGLGEDSPDNPATIADNVGDNVGDIAGMGSDLFGSFAESTCAALIVSGSSAELVKDGNYLFPLVLSAGGILICIITSFFATHVITVTEKPIIEKSLRYQLIISSILLTPLIVCLSLYCLPETITFEVFDNSVISKFTCNNTGVIICELKDYGQEWELDMLLIYFLQLNTPQFKILLSHAKMELQSILFKGLLFVFLLHYAICMVLLLLL